jgi:hypothetical protein
MDSIIYESNVDSKSIPFRIYKKDEPGPGTYNLESQFQINKASSGSKLGFA